MKREYKIRFNLGAGKNYMKWKVEGPDGVIYYDPAEVQIVMFNCQLKNQKKTAIKILQGAHKTVCAWVRCTHFHLNRGIWESPTEESVQLKYNPRVRSHWFVQREEGEVYNMDNQEVTKIITNDRKLFGIPDNI